MNLYKKNVLKHVMPMNPRRHHKYLYIDANGNYVYPEDVAKNAGNKARDLNSQGQANAVNMRKARAERIKAGNNRMADKLKSIYDQGQANNINARKARTESVNAGNERIANSKAYKIGKTILGESKAGKAIKKIGKSGIVVGKELSKVTIPEGQRAKQKSKEEIAREDAELERRVSEGIEEFGRQQAEKYYKDQAKKKAEQLPEGWVRDQNGYVYDDIRAMAVDPNDPRLKKKKKRAKKNVAKVVKTSVAHSDTYRSNVMNSHQRMIYSSQLQHAERRNHKYLYKIGDRYIYPEDVSRGIKKKAQKIINGPKTYKKDREFMKEPGNSINGINKEADQIGSAHIGSFIKKKTPDSGYQWTDRREYEEGVERRVRSGKDYSNQIERENANKEANRKVNKKRKLRDIRARKISKSIENRNRENEQARYFDEEAYKKRRKRALQHGVEWKRHKYIRKEGNRYIYPEDLEGGHRMHGTKWDNSLNITGVDRNHVDVHGNPDVVLSKRYNDRALQSGNAAKMKAKAAVANRDVSKMDEAWKDAVKADELYSKSRTGDEKKISSLMSSNIDKKAQAISMANYLDKEAKKSKIVARRKKINPDDQRKSAHAGYEADKRAFPEGGSTEELERQKKKTKARKSASKRFNELDRNNIKTSSSMEPDVQKQHSQINSAHRMATEKRMAGNKHSDREWNRQNLYSVNYYDQSGSIERQKRKTALRKRHKK